MSELELRRRVKRLGIGAKFDKGLPFRAISHLGLKFEESRVEQLLASLKAEGFDPDIVIIDTLRRILKGSENEAEAVSGFWQSVSPILAAGKTLILAHHMKKPNTNGKGQEESRNRASGSTDILAGADCGFALTRQPGGVLRVECVKSRTAKEAKAFIFSLEDNETSESTFLKYGGELSDIQKGQEDGDIQGMTLVSEFYDKAPDGLVKTGDLISYLMSKGITERTAQRWHKQFQGLWCEKARHGVYRRRAIPAQAA